MTDSAKYADILLPDAMRSEQLNMQTQGYSEYYTGVTVGGPAQQAPGECRSSYDVCADIADTFGLKDAFTEGRTHDEWVQYLYEQGMAKDKDMPSWEQHQGPGRVQAQMRARHRPQGLPRRPEGQAAGNAEREDRDLLRDARQTSMTRGSWRKIKRSSRCPSSTPASRAMAR